MASHPPFETLEGTSASITAPAGWSAGGVATGIKTYGSEPRLDVGLLVSDRPCAVAGLFTQNQICGAPVVVSRLRVSSGQAQALVVNSGCSNVAMGKPGLADARKMTSLAAAKLGLPEELVLVGSTGVIGRPLPMSKIAQGVDAIQLSGSGGVEFSRAIMTTDTFPKSRAVCFEVGGYSYTLAGTAKGSGMAHPNMATVFCFITTDAKVEARWLQAQLKLVADATINMVDVDMDTSTSDTMLAFANGAQGGPCLSDEPEAARAFTQALQAVCVDLAKDLARDGEGAKTLLEVEVCGATSLEEARTGARTVVSSPLVKTMITGRDPNLGRILMAIGRSGVSLDEARLSVWLNEHQAFKQGQPTELPLAQISREMEAESVQIRIDLGLGRHAATAWGCDLTEGYVRINADYTT